MSRNSVPKRMTHCGLSDSQDNACLGAKYQYRKNSEVCSKALHCLSFLSTKKSQILLVKTVSLPLLQGTKGVCWPRPERSSLHKAGLLIRTGKWAWPVWLALCCSWSWQRQEIWGSIRGFQSPPHPHKAVFTHTKSHFRYSNGHICCVTGK